MKKILTTVYVVICSALPLLAGTAADFSYEQDSTLGGITITKYLAEDTIVVIPEKINGIAVLAIGERAFHKKNISKVFIPNEVKSIGDGAFAESAIQEIVLPAHLKIIAQGLFGACQNLSKVTFSGNGVYGIDKFAFYGCSKLKEIALPDSIQVIAESAFENCASLQTTLPKHLRVIDDKAFSRCTNLTEVQFPTGLKYVGREAFYGCIKLQSVTLDSVEVIENQAFGFCFELSKLRLSQNLKHIKFQAFMRCDTLETLSIPASVTAIDRNVFWGCKNLKTIAVDAENNFFISVNDVLFSKDTSTLLLYPNAKSDTLYSMPNSTRTVGYAAFAGNQHLRKIGFSENLRAIEEQAFVHLKSITTLTLPNKLQMIDKEAFAHCKKLKSVTLGEGISNIGEEVFSACHSLVDIQIKSKYPPLIHDMAFYYLPENATIRVPKNQLEIYKNDNNAWTHYAKNIIAY